MSDKGEATTTTYKMKPTIYFKVTEMKNVNVYVYGGKSKEKATISLVTNNEMPSENEVYMVDASDDDGILVVAFPNKDQMDTKFAFSYWAEEILEDPVGEDDVIQNFEEDLIFMMIVGVVGVCLLCICICVICVIRKKRIQAHKIANEISPEPTDR